MSDSTGSTDAPDSGDGAMIQLSHVNKWYGDFQVLSNCTTSVSLTAYPHLHRLNNSNRM